MSHVEQKSQKVIANFVKKLTEILKVLFFKYIIELYTLVISYLERKW